jgi:enoyl-CoA hydratase/carnithine racemase
MSGSIDQKIEEGIAEINFVYEKDRSIMTPELLDAFGRALMAFETDNTVRAVLITSSGDNFCTGMDVNWFKSISDVSEIHSLNIHHQDIHRKMAQFSKPVVAALKGYTLGQGMALAIYSDIRIASEDTKMGMPEIKLGIPVMMNCVKKMISIIGIARTKELLYTGDVIDAAQALTMGLVNHLVSEADLKEKAFSFTRKIAKQSPISLSLLKRRAEFALEMSAEACFSYELSDFNSFWNSKDRKEAIRAFFEKREPYFTGE